MTIRTLELRLMDLPSNLQAGLVTTLAHAARLAMRGGLIRHPDLVECLSGRCEACAVREALDFIGEE